MRNPFRRRTAERANDPLAFSDWLSYFGFNGLSYPLGGQQTLVGDTIQVGRDFCGLASQAYMQDGIVFACEQVRLQHFSEARFKFRNQRNGRPGDLFGNPDLVRLEKPWPAGTTGDLLTWTLMYADLGGNAFILRQPNGMTLLRPDWTTIVAASKEKRTVWAPDAQVLGYIYEPGGPGSGEDPIVYDAAEVAHFAPVPDPLARWKGMSWMTPVISDIQGDRQASEHKTRFFENGATPNLIISVDIADMEKLTAFIDVFREKYEGSENAYKTMFLGAGADPTVVGTTPQQMDFKATVGVSETRIAAAAGTPPVIVGLSEGLQGSSLNAGNYSTARRRFADGTMRPLWRNACGSLAHIVNVPAGSELWYDDRDIAFLRDDAENLAEVKQKEASTMLTLINSGYEPDSIVAAIQANDWSLLKHSGLVSVQLQPPGTKAPAPDNTDTANGNAGPALAAAGTS